MRSVLNWKETAKTSLLILLFQNEERSLRRAKVMSMNENLFFSDNSFIWSFHDKITYVPSTLV